jgi:hypothetical protein
MTPIPEACVKVYVKVPPSAVRQKRHATDWLRAVYRSSRGRTRTCDPVINSRHGDDGAQGVSWGGGGQGRTQKGFGWHGSLKVYAKVPGLTGNAGGDR